MLITFMSLICLAKLTHSFARRLRAPKCFRQKLKLMVLIQSHVYSGAS